MYLYSPFHSFPGDGYDIQDGDILVTHCIYDSTNRNYTTCESRESQDEMCIANLVCIDLS